MTKTSRQSEWVFIGDTYGQACLQCPICHSRNQHVIAVYCRKGSDHDENFVPLGFVCMPLESTNERRGAVVLMVRCEDGHDWKVIVQQHKGFEYLLSEI